MRVGRGFLVLGLWSRRLTEPPRPCQRWATSKLQGKRPEGVAGAIGKPPPRLVRGETLTCGGCAATPRLLPQKEGDHPRQRMVEDILSRRSNARPNRKAYPQSA